MLLKFCKPDRGTLKTILIEALSNPWMVASRKSLSRIKATNIKLVKKILIISLQWWGGSRRIGLDLHCISLIYISLHFIRSHLSLFIHVYGYEGIATRLFRQTKLWKFLGCFSDLPIVRRSPSLRLVRICRTKRKDSLGVASSPFDARANNERIRLLEMNSLKITANFVQCRNDDINNNKINVNQSLIRTHKNAKMTGSSTLFFFFFVSFFFTFSF